MFAVWCPPPTPPMPFGIPYEFVALGMFAQLALVANGTYLLLDHFLVRKLPTMGQWGGRIMLVSTQGGLAIVGFNVADNAIIWQNWPTFHGIRWAFESTFGHLWVPLLVFGLAIAFVDFAYRRLGWAKTVLGGLVLAICTMLVAGGLGGEDALFFWGITTCYPGLIHPTLRKLAEKFIIKPRKDIWEVPRVVAVKK